MYFDDLKEKYKHLDPLTLQSHNLLEPARNGGFICPHCGNGTGKDGTGFKVDAANDGYKGFCFRCNQFFDVFDLIAAKYKFSAKTQFRDILEKAKEIFGDAGKIQAKTKTPPPPKPVEKKRDNFESLIRTSLSGLDVFFSTRKTWRGLQKATLVKFACGYLKKWYADGTERIIIPTSFFHYLARYPYDNAPPDIKLKPHRGTKEIFGLKFALEARQEKADLLIFAVEGEIDAMSIHQSGFTSIAFSGSHISAEQQTLLEKFPKESKFILMLDSDETGKKKSEDIANLLKKIGFYVSIQFLNEKFADANAWLQADPNGLKNELTRIYSDAEKFFSDNPPPKKSDLTTGIIPAGVDGYVEITPDYKPSNPPEKNSKKVREIQKTCLQIPSCPIDLTVPENFLFEPGGLKIIPHDKNGNEKNPVIFSKTPIVPVRILQKKDKSGTQIELAYFERFENIWHKITVPATTIAKTTNITDLADFGIDVNTPHSKSFSNFLMRIQRHEENAKKIPRAMIYEQTGWTSDKCENFIYPPEDEIDGQKVVVMNGGFDYESKFATKGDKNLWYELFASVYGQYAWTRYAIGLVLAAPLVKLCGSRNWQGVLVAPSGASKSAVAKLAISIFGNPEKLHTTFNGTGNFADELSPRLNDLPCWIDEFQSADENMRKNFQQLIYNYAEGKTRGRLSRNADTKKQYEFRGTRLCTSEQVVMQNNFMQGAFNRTIQLQGIEPLSDDCGRNIHENIQKSYGHYGKKYIEYVKAHKDAVRKTYAEVKKKYSTRNFIPHHLQHLALVYTALEFFYQMLKEDTELKDFIDFLTPLELLEGDIKFFRGLLPTPQDSNNLVRALDFLSEICVTRKKQFHGWQKLGGMSGDDIVKIKSTFVEAPLTPALGCIFENGDVAFFPREIDKFLTDNKYPPAETLMRGFFEQGRIMVSENIPNMRKAFKFKKSVGSLGTRAVYYFPKLAFDPNEET